MMAGIGLICKIAFREVDARKDPPQTDFADAFGDDEDNKELQNGEE